MYWKSTTSGYHAVMLSSNIELRIGYNYPNRVWEMKLYIYLGDHCLRTSKNLPDVEYLDDAKQKAVTEADTILAELKIVLRTYSRRKK